jgi:predicted alpha/beta superfamily hydrolase
VGAVVHQADTYRLRSQRVSADFEIRVARPRPAFMSAPPTQYQVLYVLDGVLFFGLATDMTRLMHQLFRELPPILVVGIGYGADDDGIMNQMRNRDFTPSAVAGSPIQGLQTPAGREPLLSDAQPDGGAGRFLDVLLDEVRPLISMCRCRYSTVRRTRLSSERAGG